MPHPQKWTLLRSQLAFDHPWYKVRRDTVELPNGQVINDYFLSVRPDVALVMPITSEGHIVFVRQYRHGAEEILLELPAGTFHPDQEKAAIAAARELREETGYTADQLIRLATLYDNPVKETNKIHLFLAPNAYRVGDPIPDLTEDIEVVQIPIDQVMERIQRGEINVAGTVAAIFIGLQTMNVNLC